jgi:hypothetical protein
MGQYPIKCNNEKIIQPGTKTSGRDVALATSSLTSKSTYTNVGNAASRQTNATMLLGGIEEDEFELYKLTTGFQVYDSWH